MAAFARSWWLCGGVAAWLSLACHQGGGTTRLEPPPAPPPAPTPGPPPPPGPQVAGPAFAGPAPLRRLTRFQYANTVRDLLGADPSTIGALMEDGLGPSGFHEADLVGVEGLRGLMETAERIAADAVERLPALLPCDPARDERACVEAFLATFGGRVFRRPLTPAETSEAWQLFVLARQTLGYQRSDALRVLLSALLQSPKFLYLWERGCPNAVAGAGPVPLCPHEVAARLSYFLWSSMPDQALFAAAERGELAGEAAVEREARRMLRDPKARDTVGWYHRQWLNLGPLEPEGSPFPVTRALKAGYDGSEQPALLRSMDRETWEFTANLLDGDGRLETLLTAPFSFIDERLARLYGAEPVGDGGFARRTLANRGGILTHASFLWVHSTAQASHPIKRGKAIYERVLCGHLAPPPAEVPAPRPPGPATSTRERYAEHQENACAKACHALMDPLGFALESFDALGRYRAEDGGKPVDTSGVASFPLEGSRPFADTAEFLRILGVSEDARRCQTRQWLRFAFGRLEADQEAAMLDHLYEVFSRSGFDVRALLVAITTTPSFLFLPAPGAAP
jgi:hypothetical protein